MSRIPKKKFVWTVGEVKKFLYVNVWFRSLREQFFLSVEDTWVMVPVGGFGFEVKLFIVLDIPELSVKKVLN